VKSITTGAFITKAHAAVKVGKAFKPLCGPGSGKRYSPSNLAVSCKYCLQLLKKEAA